MKSKRFKKLPEKTSELSADLIEKLLPVVKANCTTKFDESVDLSFQINNKQKKSEINIRTVVNMPSGTGKKIKVAVLCDDSKKTSAEKAGADLVGGDDLIEKIASGKFNFTKLICTPSMMGKIGKHGKVLGPKGLMPNPKVGTVTPDVATAVKNAKAGQVRYRADKSGIVHAGIGKASFEVKALEENIAALIEALKKAKPSSAKGVYFKKISVSSTMGPGLSVDGASVNI